MIVAWINSSVWGKLKTWISVKKKKKKKKTTNAICKNMGASRDFHTKWNNPERKRKIPYDITYLWNLKYGTDYPI